MPSSTPTQPSTRYAAFDSARALEHVRVLAVDIGSRPAGSEAEDAAAAYIRDELASYGYGASLQPFTFPTYEDDGTILELVSPEQRGLDVNPLQPSVGGAVEAELVAAGRGSPEEFPEGAAGKIALIERGTINFGEKVSNAAAAGAVGVILYNDRPGALIPRPSSAGDIPAAAISQEDGTALLGLMQAGPAVIRLDVRTRGVTLESQNVVARPPDGECHVIAGGHYDSVAAGPGGNDNGSGTGTVIEMARDLAADGIFDDTCFVLFGAEEVGLLGSEYYVANLSSSERASIDGVLNFDMMGVGAGWPLVGSPEMVSVATQEAEALGIAYSTSDDLPAGAGSDHASFIDAGIPAILFNCFCDSAYHSSGDVFENVEQERLAEGGALGLAIIDALLGEREPGT